jgi:predicted SnoaL-like aldol condensation-catalyzing enzyme
MEQGKHNPVVPTGRKGFMRFFAALGSPIEIQPTIQEPVIAIVAEKDMVIISFVVKKQEPAKPGLYTTTAFDMFQNGLIAEHWDSELK